MDAQLRRFIRDRAGDRCEYCLVPQAALKMPLQVEHIIAVQHQGESNPDNLALACDRCNLYKGTNLSSVDPQSGQITRLFDPRRDAWTEHFSLLDDTILGITPTGRATVRLLQFNADNRVRLRRLLMLTGQW